ncbi:hypothetical protein ACFQV4_27745 [Streptomyces thermocarboxydus]
MQTARSASRTSTRRVTVPADVGEVRVRIVEPPDPRAPCPSSSICTAGDGCSATP